MVINTSKINIVFDWTTCILSFPAAESDTVCTRSRQQLSYIGTIVLQWHHFNCMLLPAQTVRAVYYRWKQQYDEQSPPLDSKRRRRRFWHATHDCVAPYVDIILNRGRFWVKSAASGSVRWWCFRSCWMVLSHVMWGRPSCLLQSAGAEANRILLASALSSMRTRIICPNKVSRRDWMIAVSLRQQTPRCYCYYHCITITADLERQPNWPVTILYW